MQRTPNTATLIPKRICQLISAEAFLPDIHAANKADVLQAVSQRAAAFAPSISAQTIFDVLWEREELGSTGIEAGIAIPHGRFKSIKTPILVVGKTSPAINFGAIDEMPSDLFFTLLAPTSSNDHLNMLSRLARMFQIHKFADQMRYCQTPEQMYHCFQNWEAALPC